MSVIQVQNKQFELFISEDEIRNSIKEVSQRMISDLHDKNPLIICVLNGVFIFAADLIRCFEFPCEVAFIRLKSYSGTNSSGKIIEINGLVEDVKGRNVVIIEDIVDTGNTIQYLKQNILSQQPESLRIATLFLKPEALQVDVDVDYVVMKIPNEFIVGYGLDYNGYGRNFRNVYKIKEIEG